MITRRASASSVVSPEKEGSVLITAAPGARATATVGGLTVIATVGLSGSALPSTTTELVTFKASPSSGFGALKSGLDSAGTAAAASDGHGRAWLRWRPFGGRCFVGFSRRGIIIPPCGRRASFERNMTSRQRLQSSDSSCRSC